MEGENVTHMYTEYLLFSFKEANAAICDNRGKPGRQWVNEVSQAPDGPVATRVEVLWGKGSGEHRKSSQRTAETHRQLRNLVSFWACLSLEFHQESFWKPQHLYDLGRGDLGVTMKSTFNTCCFGFRATRFTVWLLRVLLIYRGPTGTVIHQRSSRTIL